MRLFDVILLALCAVGMIIGIYEVMAVGLGQGYFPIMMSLLFFFWFVYRKKSKEA